MGIKSEHSACTRTAGFTLVEIMAVVLIILILAGLVIGIAGNASRKADAGATQALLARIAMGLENYKAEMGTYPAPTSNGSIASSVMERSVTTGMENFMDWKPTEVNEGNFVDAWNRPIQYVFDPAKSDTYQLWSMGPNGKSGNAEDRKDDLSP